MRVRDEVLGLLMLTLLVAALWWLIHPNVALGGPNTRIFESLCESADQSEWDAVVETNGNDILDSSVAANSIGKGLAVKTSGTNGKALVTKGQLPHSEYWHSRYYLNVWDYNAVNFPPVVAKFFHTPIGKGVITYTITELGEGYVFKTTYVTDISPTEVSSISLDTLQDSTWYRIDTFAKFGAGDGIFAIYIDGQQKYYNDTLTNDTTAIDSFHVGYFTSVFNGDAGCILFDDIVIDTMPCAAPDCSPSPVKAELGSSDLWGFVR